MTRVRYANWALWAPAVGFVINGGGFATRQSAEIRLSDRKANGEAFPGERVKRDRAAARAHCDTCACGRAISPAWLRCHDCEVALRRASRAFREANRALAGAHAAGNAAFEARLDALASVIT